MVAFIILFLFGIAVGAMLEHYLRPTPKLNNEEMMDALDRIWAYGKGDYKTGRKLMNELYDWMYDVQDISLVSKELEAIIDAVQNKQV